MLMVIYCHLNLSLVLLQFLFGQKAQKFQVNHQNTACSLNQIVLLYSCSLWKSQKDILGYCPLSGIRQRWFLSLTDGEASGNRNICVWMNIVFVSLSAFQVLKFVNMNILHSVKVWLLTFYQISGFDLAEICLANDIQYHSLR